MNYEDLNEQQVKEYEQHLIKKADNFWVQTFGKTEGSDVDKLRLLSRQGKLQNKFQHDIMTNYFKKLGLWRDGKTTLDQRKKDLILEKQKFGRMITQIKNSKISDINTLIERAEAKKQELEKIPETLKEEFKIDKDKILERLNTDLETLYETSKLWIDKEISNIYDNFINTTKNKQESLIQQARTEIERLQKQQKARIRRDVENYSSELEAELTVLNYVENDNSALEKYNDEVKAINQELNELDEVSENNEILVFNDTGKDLMKGDPINTTDIPITTNQKTESNGLEDYTVAELKKMADSLGIEYNARILKADLIELIDKS